jgi:hypothetical protein
MERQVPGYLTMGRLLFMLAVCWMPVAGHASERVSSVVREDGAIEFQIHEPEAGKYTLTIEDVKDGKSVATVTSFEKGAHIPVRVARLAAGLKPGVYRFKLQRDGATVYEGGSPDPAWKGDFETTAGTFERRDSQVLWSASRPALSRVLIMSQSGAILHILKDWHFAGAGRQPLAWDYQDGEKAWNFSSYPALQVLVQSLPLPDGWLVVGQPEWKAYKSQPMFAPIASRMPDSALDFGLKLEATSRQLKVNEEPRSVFFLKEGTLLKTALGESARNALEGQRYEILLYLDGEFFHEESQGIDPYTYKFPAFPQSLSPSFLTVNLLDYRGNVATRTLAIRTGEAP